MKILISLIILCCLVFNVVLSGSIVSGSSICTKNSEILPTEINVAILVWVDSDEILLSKPLSSYPPIPQNSTGFKGLGPVVLQPFYLGVEFYKRQLAKFDHKIPVLGGTHHVTLNMSYINMGRIDWNLIYPSNGFPVDGMTSLTRANQPGGLYDKLLFNASTILGGNKSFTFFVPHPLLPVSVLGGLLNRIEDERLAVVVHPFSAPLEAFVCDGKPFAISATPDCTSPLYNRQRLLGARRYETMFGVLPDLSADAATTLALYHLVGARRVAIFRDATLAASTYSKLTFEESVLYAEELNLQVVLTGVLVVACPGAPNCPPASISSTQTQIWPNGTTGLEWASKLESLNVDAVMIIGTPSSGGCWSFGQLIHGMQQIDWTPKILSWIGAFEKTTMPEYLPNGKDDMLYTTGEILWHRSLRGKSFQTKTTSTNFELIEATTTQSTPTIFANEFDRVYGPGCVLESCTSPEPHPFWNGYSDGGAMPAASYSAMVQVQKLIEASVSTNIDTILNSASKINTPSLYYQLGFDSYGRTKRFDVVVTQYNGTSMMGGTTIVSPFNIGTPTVYPMPNWQERIFSPQWYSTTSEQVMTIITSFSIIWIIGILSVVMYFIRNPIIRATTPSFACLISGGGIIMLVSNFFNTLHTNTYHCAANAWLLTLGFTLLFSSLFIKTFRIWKIFGRERLQVTRMRDSDLAKAVVCFLIVDILLNIIWQYADGMPSILVVIDPLRPKFNFYTCDYSSNIARGIMYTHVILKATLMVGGIVLTWAVRNVPTSFNESLLMSICIYNVSILACFVVPIVYMGLGGRTVTFLVRAFATIFLTISTQALLYVPRLYLIYTKVNPGKDNNVTRLSTDTEVRQEGTLEHGSSYKNKGSSLGRPGLVHSNTLSVPVGKYQNASSDKRINVQPSIHSPSLGQISPHPKHYDDNGLSSISPIQPSRVDNISVL